MVKCLFKEKALSFPRASIAQGDPPPIAWIDLSIVYARVCVKRNVKCQGKCLMHLTIVARTPPQAILASTSALECEIEKDLKEIERLLK